MELKADTDFTCEGASNIIIASVDPIYQNDVTYTLDGNLTQESGIFENVSKGKHMVSVTHKEYGCTDVPIEVVIEEYTPITFDIVENMRLLQVVADPIMSTALTLTMILGPTTPWILIPSGNQGIINFTLKTNEDVFRKKRSF